MSLRTQELKQLQPLLVPEQIEFISDIGRGPRLPETLCVVISPHALLVKFAGTSLINRPFFLARAPFIEKVVTFTGTYFI